jgi:hypothetical protein
MTDVDYEALMVTRDPMEWAGAFCRTVASAENPGADATDPGFVVGWFSNFMAAVERSPAPHDGQSGRIAAVSKGLKLVSKLKVKQGDGFWGLWSEETGWVAEYAIAHREEIDWENAKAQVFLNEASL